MSSSPPISSDELSTMANKGSAESSPSDMPPSDDSNSNTSLATERLNRFIEDECTTPTGLLPVETEDATKPSPSTERIEGEINAFNNAFGDDTNGIAKHDGSEQDDEDRNQDVEGEENQKVEEEEEEEEDKEGKEDETM